MKSLRRLTLLTVTLLAVSLAACADERPPVCERRIAVVVNHEVYVPLPPKDILFVVDNSPSMIDEQTRVHDGVLSIIEGVSMSPNPWHLGVITMDLDSPVDGGRLRLWPNGDRWAEWPPPAGADIDGARQDLLNGLDSVLLDVGTDGSHREAGLQAMRRALDPTGPEEVVAHNTGFLRPEAELIVMILSDEDDCSATDFSGDDGADTWCAERATLDPVEDYVDMLAALKPDLGVRAVRVTAAIGGVYSLDSFGLVPRGCWAGPEGADDACGCWTNATSGDDSACGLLAGLGHSCSATCDPECEALPGARYVALAEQLGARRADLGYPRGTMRESICSSLLGPWGNLIRIVTGEGCYALELPVHDPSRVRVEVRTHDPWTGEEKTIVLPQFDPYSAGCRWQSCTDCADGAWELVTPQMLCLSCGLRKSDLAEATITVVQELAIGDEDC